MGRVRQDDHWNPKGWGRPVGRLLLVSISLVPGAAIEYQSIHCEILGQPGFFNLDFSGKALGGGLGRKRCTPVVAYRATLVGHKSFRSEKS